MPSNRRFRRRRRPTNGKRKARRPQRRMVRSRTIPRRAPSALQIWKRFAGFGNASPSHISGTSIPAYRKVKLVYYQDIALGDASDAPFIHSFRLNSMFDPDLTGTGHQPKGFDFWAAGYTRYLVYGTAYNYFFRTDETNQIHAWIVTTIEGSTSGTIPNIWQEAQETPSVRKLLLRGSSEDVKDEWQAIKGYVSMYKFRLPQQGTTLERMSASNAASPATIVHHHIFAEDTNSDPISSSGLKIGVRLTFYAIMFDPKGNYYS